MSLAALICACGIASPPIQSTPHIVETPQNGQLAISSHAESQVGQVVPVYVSVTNGSDEPRTVTANQVFALDSGGNRIAPIPPGEAARQAGDAQKLKAAITSGAVSGVGEGALGAGIGALTGPLLGRGVGTGAAIGGAFGAGHGIVRGAQAGQAQAERQANQQINALALRSGEVRRDFTQSGYVFFPAGSYSGLELVLVNRESGGSEVVKEPWR